MMRLALKWSLVALVSIAVSAVYAQEPTVFRERTRFLGMGGVGIAVVDDESALFYNPAALTKVDGTKWSLINLQARVSEDILDLDDIADEVDAAPTDPEKVRVLSSHVPLRLSADVGNLITYARRNFGWALLAEGNLRGDIVDRVLPRAEGSGVVDGAFLLGYAHEFNSHNDGPRHAIGVVAKFIYRRRWVKQGTTELNFTTTDLIHYDDIEVDHHAGRGIGLDIGYLVTLDRAGRTRLGFLYRDVFGTKLNYSGLPDRVIKSRWSIGFARRLGAIEGVRVSDSIFAFDITDIGRGGSFWTKVHLGGEVTWGTPMRHLQLRAGFNQGYFTWGVGFQLGSWRVDYARFSEELTGRVGTLRMKSHVITIGFIF